MKTLSLPLPVVRVPGWNAFACASAAALTAVAGLPQFRGLEFGNPAFTTSIYLALTGLAALQSDTSPAMRRLTWAPVFAHMILIAFAGLSLLREGHWPWYGMPDPSNLKLPLVYGAAVLAVLSAFFALPAGLLAMLVGLISSERGGWRENALPLLHAAAVWACGVWLWAFELREHRLLDWLAD